MISEKLRNIIYLLNFTFSPNLGQELFNGECQGKWDPNPNIPPSQRCKCKKCRHGDFTMARKDKEIISTFLLVI